MVPASLLQADLHHALRTQDRVPRLDGGLDAVGERLLAIGVLSRLAGLDEHRGMPVIGSCDQDRIDVLALQHAPVIRVRLRRGALRHGRRRSGREARGADRRGLLKRGQRLVAVGLERVGHGHHLAVRIVTAEHGAHVTAASAETKHPHANSVVRARCGARRGGRQPATHQKSTSARH